MSLVEQALLACFWLARLPDYTSLYFSVILNLIFATLQTLLVFEWLGFLLFRGSDSGISKILEGVREYPTEKELTDDAPRVTKEHKRALPLVTLLQQPPPVVDPREAEEAYERQVDVLDDQIRRQNMPSNREILERSSRRTWTAGELVLVLAWLVLLAPATSAWLVAFNILPAVELFFPNNAIRGWMSALYMVVVVFLAWSSACQQWLQMLQENFVEIKEAQIAFAAKLRDKWESGSLGSPAPQSGHKV